MSKHSRMAIGCATIWMLLAGACFPVSAAPESHGAGKSEEVILPLDYLPVPPVNVPLFKNNKVAGSLRVDMVLNITDVAVMAHANKNRVRLSPAYADALTRWAAVFQDPSTPVNVIAIKNQLQNVTIKILGSDEAVVLLQTVMLRR